MNSAPYTAQLVPTPDGPFALIANAEGLVIAAGWTDDPSALARRSAAEATDLRSGVVTAAAAVHAYYDGDVDAPLRVPLAVAGTPFQQQVWQALRSIPAGQCRTYGELALMLGAPTAVRAVAGGCGRNRAALFIPCHRVVGADGSLTGFAWGVEVKRRLLVREGAFPGGLDVSPTLEGF